jgi:hypothetical protein
MEQLTAQVVAAVVAQWELAQHRQAALQLAVKETMVELVQAVRLITLQAAAAERVQLVEVLHLNNQARGVLELLPILLGYQLQELDKM